MGYYYPNGLSNKSGAYSLMRGKVYTSRPVLYVHSEDGDDSNGGTSYLRPKATLQSAVDAANGDHTIIVLKSGSSEAVSTSIDLAGKPVTIVGESLVGGDPDAELEPAVGLGSASILTTASAPDGVELANIRTLPRGAASSVANVILAGDYDAVRDCQFQCGEHEDGLLDIDGDFAFVSSCKFESAESTANSSQIPALEGSGTVSDACENCVFDAGPFGTISSVDLMSRALNATLLRGVRVDAEFLRYATVGESSLGGGVEDVPDGGLLLSDGISDAGSDPLVSGDPTFISADGVLYVDSVSGDDANDGSACEPLATLAEAIDQANTATSSPVILLRSTHKEVVSTGIVANTGVTIVGEDGAEISLGSSSITALRLDGDVSELRNVAFVSESGITGCTYVQLQGAGSLVTGCDLSLHSGATGIRVGDTGVHVSKCKLHGPGAADGMLLIGAPAHATVRDCEFDAEGEAFSGAAIRGFVGVSGMRMSGITLKNCAHIDANASSTGYIQVVESDDTCHVEAF